MKCSCCGSEVLENVDVCPNCGESISNFVSQTNKSDTNSNDSYSKLYSKAKRKPLAKKINPFETHTLVTIALLLSICMPFLGLILGIIASNSYTSLEFKKQSNVAIGVSVCMIMITIVIAILAVLLEVI